MGWTLTEVNNYVQKVEKTLSSAKERKLKGLAFAKLFKEVKELSTAQRYVQEYISVNARDFRAYSFLGQLLEDSQDWQGAIKAYKKSLDINGNQKDVLLKVVELHSRVPVDPERAKVWVDKASKLCPGHPSVFSLKWHLLVSAPVTDYDQMEDVLTEELARRPREASLHIKLVKLYDGLGNLEQACSHCQKVEKFRIFDKELEWLACVVETTEKYYHQKLREGNRDGSWDCLMTFFAALCKLLELHLKVSTVRMATDILTRLDNAVYNFEQLGSSVTRQTRHELDVMIKEIKGQLYYFSAVLLMKMAVEHRLTWEKAQQLACASLMASYQVIEPEPLQPWNTKRSPQKGNKPMIWSTMAFVRLSQTGHLILQLHREKGIEWIKKCIGNICTRQGRNTILSTIYSLGIPTKSYLANDVSYIDLEVKIPDPHQLMTYDGHMIGSCISDLQLICWIGLHWYSIKEQVRPGVGTLVSRLFNDIVHDVKDLDNCQSSSLCHRDIEAFVYAVLRSSADRVLESRDQPFEEGEPRLLPFPLSRSLVTKQQVDWWGAAYGLYTGRLGNMSAAKQKNIVQCGLEVIRGFKNHGIDPRILLYIANAFLGKANELCSFRQREWDYQVHIESLQKRGFYYMKQALVLFESQNRNKTQTPPQSPLFPPLNKPLLDSECHTNSVNIKIKLGRAAIDAKDYNVALRYLNEVETPLAAYEEAWVYRNLASEFDVVDVESLRDHLFHLRKARERYEACLRRFGSVKNESKSIVLEELDEIRFAIQSGRGLGYQQEKRLDISNIDEEIEECPDEIFDADLTIEEKEREIDQLTSENSTLQNRVSFLEARLNAVQNEVELLRMRRGRDDSASSSDNGKPRSLNGESNNFMQLSLKEENASGRATPKLETEMSWDSFSPAPLIDKGYFAGLASRVEKIEEEDNDDKKDRGVNEAGQEEEVDGDHAEKFDDGVHFEPLIRLSKKTVHSTGEEDEKAIFSNRAKLYRFDSELSQWKERGIGEMKILVDCKSNSARILMRRDQVLRICANHVITPEMKLEPKEGSRATFVWFTFADSSYETPTHEKFACRFKTVEIANDFKEKFENCQQLSRKKLDVNSSGKGDEIVASNSGNKYAVSTDIGPLKTWQCERCKSGNPMARTLCIQCNYARSKIDVEQGTKFLQGTIAEPATLDERKITFQPPLNGPPADSIALTAESQTENKPKFSFNFSVGEALVSPPKSSSSELTSNHFATVTSEPLDVKSRSASERSLNNSSRADVDRKLVSSPKPPNVYPSASEQSLRPASLASEGFYDFFSSQVTKSASHPCFPNGFGTTQNQGHATTLSTDSLAAGGFPVLDPSTTTGGTLSSQFPVLRGLLGSTQGQGARLPLLTEQTKFADDSAVFDFRNTFSNPADGQIEENYGPRFNFFGVTSTRPVFGDQTEPREIDEEEFFRQNWDVEEDDYYDDDEYYDEELIYQYESGEYHRVSGMHHEQDVESEDEEEDGTEYSNSASDFFVHTAGQKVDSDDEYFDAFQDNEKRESKDQDGGDSVPFVVQMVDDDTFITFASKTSRAQRAKAARFLLPPTFYVQENCSPCTGCIGCEKGHRRSGPVSKMVERPLGTTSLTSTDVDKAESVSTEKSAAAIPFGGHGFGFSFSDLAKKQGTMFNLSGRNQTFKGAGTVLFSSERNDRSNNSDDEGQYFEPVTRLEKLADIKTGEEGEMVMFVERAKLYRFDGNVRQWKERGVGDMKILKNSETGNCRVLMRRDYVRKICANHLITSDMRLAPHGTSQSAWVWVTGADYTDDQQPKVEKLAVKFKLKDTATKFYDVFMSCVSQENSIATDQSNISVTVDNGVVSSITQKKEPSASDINSDSVINKGLTDQRLGVTGALTEPRLSIDAADSIRQRFALKDGAWECETCLVANTGADSKCAACQSPKPGLQLEQQSQTVLANADNRQQRFTFGVPLVEKKVDPTSHIVGLKEDAQKPNSSMGIQTCVGITASATHLTESSLESSTDVMAVSAAIRSKFAPPPGSWECTVCLVRNEDKVYECVACQSPKPGIDFNGQKTSNSMGTKLPPLDVSGPQFKFSFGVPAQPSSLPMIGAGLGGAKEGNLFGFTGIADQSAYSAVTPAVGQKLNQFQFGAPADNVSYSEVQITPKDQLTTTEASPHIPHKGVKQSSLTPSPALATTGVNLSSFWSRPLASTSFFTPPAQTISASQTETPFFTPPSFLTSDTLLKENAPSQLFGASRVERLEQPSAVQDAAFSLTGFKGKTLFTLGSFPENDSQGNLETELVTDPAPKETMNVSKSSETNLSSLFGGGQFSFQMKLSDVSNSKDDAKNAPEFQAAASPKSPYASPIKTEDSEEDGGQAFSPVVILERVTVNTGEENEAVVYSERAKLFRFDASSRQWKERGVGNLSILQHIDNGQSRLVMRRDHVLKLCANHYLVEGMTLTPMGDTGKAYIWKAFADLSGDDCKQETLAVKFRSKDRAIAFKDVFEKAVNGITLSPITQVTPKVHRSRVSSTSEDVDPCYSNKVLDPPTTSPLKSPFQNLPSVQETPPGSICTAEATPSTDELEIVDAREAADENVRHAEHMIYSENTFSSETNSSNKGIAVPSQSRNHETGTVSTSEVSKTSSSVTQTPTAPPVSEFRDSPEREDHRIEFTPVVVLGKERVFTGEESEVVKFIARVKLYRFDRESKQWKERGIGELKILQRHDSGRCRLIVRRDQVKKLCANHYITSDMTLEKLAGGKNSLTWFTPNDFSEQESRPEKFAARFMSLKILEEFEESFHKAKIGKHFNSDSTDQCDRSERESVAQEESLSTGLPVKLSQESTVQDSEIVSSVGITSVSLSVKEEAKPAMVHTDLGKADIKSSTEENSLDVMATTNVISVCEEASFSVDDDVTELFVKQPSDDERAKATKLLLPACFFTISETTTVGNAEPSRNKESHLEQPPLDSNSKNIDEHVASPMQTNFESKEGSAVLSFADLCNKSEGVKPFSGAGSQFKGQGSPVFTSNENDPEHFEPVATYNPVLTLQKVETLTGEENEQVVFHGLCKMYIFDSDARHWKERGVGALKILTAMDGQSRILMRRDQTLKIGANHFITKHMQLQPKVGSETTYVWHTNADISGGTPSRAQFAARFKAKSIADEFKNTFESCQDTTRSAGPPNSSRDDEFSSRNKSEQDSQSEQMDSTLMMPHATETVNKDSKEASQQESCISGNESTATEIVEKDSHEEKKEVEGCTNTDVSYSFAPIGLTTRSEECTVGETKDVQTELALGKGETTDLASQSSLGFTFGSSSICGLTFQSIAQSSESFSKKEGDSFRGAGSAIFTKSSNEEEDKCSDDATFEPIVRLQRIDVKTGEEEEEVILTVRVKMYRYHSETKQWKERGVGNLKILRHIQNNVFRLIVRRDQVGKLCANHLLTPELKLSDFRMSKRTLTWQVFADFAEGVQEQALFAARFTSEENMEKFRDTFEAICSGRWNNSDISQSETVPASEESGNMPGPCVGLQEALNTEFGVV